MKFVRIIIKVFLSLLVLLLMLSGGIFCYLKYKLLTPEQLSELVTREINRRANVEFCCERVDLSYWDNWPFIEIVVKDGSFQIQDKSINAEAPFAGKFKKISGSIQLLKLWKEHVISIDNILVENLELVYNAEEPIPKLTKKKGHKLASKLLSEIDRLQISQGDIKLKIPHRKQIYNCKNADILIEGKLGQGFSDISLSVSSPVMQGTGLPLDSISFDLFCHVKLDKEHAGVELSDAHFKINDFPFNLEGKIMNLKRKQVPFIDLQFDLGASSLKDLIAFIPSDYFPIKEDYQIDGTTILKGTIHGAMKKDSLPDLHIQGSLEQGRFHWAELREDLENIQLNLEMKYSSACADSCFLRLNRFFVKGMQSEINLEGTVMNFVRDSYIEACIKGNLNFDYIGKKVLMDKKITLAGMMMVDARLGCAVNELRKKNYHLIKGAGKLKIQNVVFDHLEKEIHFFIPDVSLDFGYAKNASDFIKQTEVFSGVAEIDTLCLSYKKKLFVNLSDLRLRSNTAISLRKDEVSPITTHWNCKLLDARWNNSSAWTSIQNLELHVGVKPIGNNLLNGEGGLMFKADKLRFLNPYRQQAFIFDKIQLISEIRPVEEKRRTGEKHNLKGVLEFERSQMYIPQFPMLTCINHAYLGFQNHQLTLNRLHVQAGKSDCFLSGSLSVADAKNKRSGVPQVEGSLRILSANIDYDELERTLSYGVSSEKLQNSKMMAFGDLNNLESQLHVQEPIKLKQHPVYISKNIALELQFDLDHMNYRNVDLQHVQGSAFVRNQALKAHLTTRTNLGKAELDLLYNSLHKDKVTTCFDLKLKDFLVAQVHEVIPTVKTIFPLIETMDGLVNCRLTAVGPVDNRMLPLLGNTDAICSVDGRNLILMDNGTFKEIARRFRFKNKEKHEIDKLSANLILHKKKIEVLPFVLQWDRYKAIVGGEHSIDLTYNYHMDLLDSPIPIDFGIDLSGKEGQFKYKLRKCKYKDLFKDGGIQYDAEVEKRLSRIRQAIIHQMQ